VLQSGARVTTPPSNFTVATYTVEALIPIDFANVPGLRPKDSAFRTSALQLFQLALTFGNAGDCFVGGTMNFSSMNVDVFSQELIERRGKGGGFSMPAFLKKTSFQQINVAAANTALGIDLPAGNRIGRVIIRAAGDVTAGEPSATVLAGVIAKNGEDYRCNLPAALLRGKNNMDGGQLTAGYYIWNPMALGQSPEHFSNSWNVRGNSQPQLVLDTAGGANVVLQIATEEYIPRRAA
jgi:hypothetical protein